jgi:hypothetical protein
MTFPGLIKLLSLSHDKEFDRDIWEQLRRHVPAHFRHVFQKLSGLFSDEDLFKTLARACNDVTLRIIGDVRKAADIPRSSLPPSLDLDQYELIKYFDVKINVNYLYSKYSIIRKAVITGSDRAKKEMRRKQNFAFDRLQDLIFSVFLYGLTVSRSTDYFEEHPIQHIIAPRPVLKIIKSNPIAREIYLGFLKEIERKEQLQATYTRQIKKYMEE